jgi:outer membrane protein assembly factor BamB
MVNLTEPPGSFDWRGIREPVGVLWKADLGSQCHGHPVIAGGKVFVGTNNGRPRNQRDFRGKPGGGWEPLDKGVLMCFDQTTGKFLWQAVFDNIEGGMVQDWPDVGICSTPAVEGDRLYFVTNRCTVVCADVNGLTDGRQGAVVREKYSDPTDADIFWEFDMRAELKVFPHNMSNCYPLIVGDLLFVCTSNGVDEGHFNIPSPDAPSFIALNKHTGKLVWKNNDPGKNIMHGQWASPSYTDHPVPQVIFPGGDGWLRAFDPPTGRLIWKFDANPPGSVYQLGGTGTRNDFIAAPSICHGRLYIGVGQDPEHTDGIGRLWCIDIKKAVEGGARNKDRDVSPELLLELVKNPGRAPTVKTKPNPDSAAVWCYTGVETRPFSVRDFRMGRMMGGVTVVDGIAYAAELPGYVHCMNAATGEHYWQYDTKAPIWTTPYYVGGKVLIGNDNGDLHVFRHDKRPQVIDDIAPAAANQRAARAFRLASHRQIADKYLVAKVEFDTSIRTTPCVAGGVLYLATEKTLYAIGSHR